MPTFGSLFAGIGGFDLGFERAGWKCSWQVEIDPFCRRVLAKHWPDVPRHDDVRTFPQGDPEDWRVDAIIGGFPCQDVSTAGRRAGIGEGTRSGLWSEYRRVVALLRPRVVVVENTAGLLAPIRERGEVKELAPVGCVLGELSEIGYDAEWQTIPASAFGAPHIRERVFIVAYPAGERLSPILAGRRAEGEGAADVGGRGEGDTPANDDQRGLRGRGRGQVVGAAGGVRGAAREQRVRADAGTVHGGRGSEAHAHADCERSLFAAWDEAESGEDEPQDRLPLGSRRSTEGGDEGGERRAHGQPCGRDSPFVGHGWWGAEPDVVRMVYGVPRRVVRPAISGLGNAVVPQVAEWIGRRILTALETPA